MKSWAEFFEPVLAELYQITLEENNYMTDASKVLASLSVSRLLLGMNNLARIPEPDLAHFDGERFAADLLKEAQKSLPPNPEQEDIVRALDNLAHRFGAKALFDFYDSPAMILRVGEEE